MHRIIFDIPTSQTDRARDKFCMVGPQGARFWVIEPYHEQFGISSCRGGGEWFANASAHLIITYFIWICYVV